jgi:NAD(P)-dependent dehydrogenase (short-subunit alcohol dehydrogenase family)
LGRPAANQLEEAAIGTTVLITGANRGLGLQFAKQYADDGWRVHAACRNPDAAEALNEAAAGGAMTLHRLDVGDGDQVGALAAALAGEAIDVLLNNAGVIGDRSAFGATDYTVWQATLRTNTLAPMRMAEAFADHVAASGRKQMVFVSSRMGSIGDNGEGGSYVYRSSKAALNAVIKSLSIDLAARGVTAVAFHPGWVSTDMGGASAPIGPAESVGGMRRVIERLTPADNGRFLDYDGSEIPW